MDNDIVTWNPVNRCRDSVLVASLKRIDDAEHLGRIAARRSRIGHDQSDGLLGIDNEDGADGEGDALLVDIRRILLVQHVIEQSDLPLLVADDGKLQVAATDLVDILDPTAVAFNGVGRKADKLHSPPGEFRLQLGESTQLGGADRSVVLRV